MEDLRYVIMEKLGYEGSPSFRFEEYFLIL